MKELTYNFMNENGLPEILYKYRNSEKSTIDWWLKCNEIFFADPNDFNDPFDIQIRKKTELMPDKDFILQMVYTLSKTYKNQPFDFLWNIASNEYFNKLEKDKDHYKNNAIEACKQGIGNIKRGVICLSEERENILMWSHYSDSNKGFCIGYDTEILAESVNKSLKLLGIFKVKYSNEYPIILPTIGHSNIQIRDKLAVKSLLWSYEKEWRLIIQNENKISVALSEYAVKEIIMGAKIEEEKEEAIIKIQKEKYPHAKLLKIVPDDSEFKLNTIEIN